MCTHECMSVCERACVLLYDFTQRTCTHSCSVAYFIKTCSFDVIREMRQDDIVIILLYGR